MKSFFKSLFVRALGVLALALIGVMIYSASTGGIATLPEKVVGIVVTPLQSFVTGVSDGFSGFIDRLTGSGDLQQRVEALEKENAELRQQIADYDQLKQENEWYSEILGLHERQPDYTFASGRVIGRDPTDVYGNFTISAGTNADVSVNDPVITTDGSLVGVIEEVGLTYAKVRTVLDSSSKVSAQISRTGDTGYTSSSSLNMIRNKSITLSALERSSGAAIGDYIVTSGIGGVYPSGLLIGEVTAVNGAPDGMTLDATVSLFADVFDLKQVMVITSFEGQGGE